MDDSNIIFLHVFCAAAVCFFIIGGAIGVNRGHEQACASVHAEWRDGKCVKVIVEDVK